MHTYSGDAHAHLLAGGFSLQPLSKCTHCHTVSGLKHAGVGSSAQEHVVVVCIFPETVVNILNAYMATGVLFVVAVKLVMDTLL